VPIALLLAVARERLTTSPVEGIVSGIGVLVGSLVAVAVADVPYPTVFGG
jgi:predicted RecA/RadA family phage recombinase